MADGRHQPGGSEKDEREKQHKHCFKKERYNVRYIEEKPRLLGALRRGSGGCSIVLLVDIDARDVFEAVAEFFQCEHQRV